MVKKIICLALSVMCIVSMSACKEEKKRFETGTITSSEQQSDLSSDKTTSSDENKTSSQVNNSTTTEKNSSSNKGESSVPVIDMNDYIIPESSKVEEVKTYIEPLSFKNTYKLNNTKKKLDSGETLKVVYFGTSVSTGSSWVDYVTSYLKTLGKVSAVNSSVGGAGSYAALARFENEVIAKNPDLVFIELSINDLYRGFEPEDSKKNIEYMIRRLYEKNPYADIVVLFAPNTGTFGKQYESYLAHKEVADHYKIPCVDFGIGMFNLVKGSKEEFSKYLQDSVHPNAEGYKTYAEIVKTALKELFTNDAKKKHTLPAVLVKNNYTTVTNYTCLNNDQLKNLDSSSFGIAAWNSSDVYEKSGCQFRSKDIKNIFPKYIYPKKTKVSFEFKFTGNSITMLGSIKDVAGLNFTLDGKATKMYGGTTLAEVIEYPLFNNLENKQHTLKVEVIGTQPHVAIAGFVVTQ